MLSRKTLVGLAVLALTGCLSLVGRVLEWREVWGPAVNERSADGRRQVEVSGLNMNSALAVQRIDVVPEPGTLHLIVTIALAGSGQRGDFDTVVDVPDDVGSIVFGADRTEIWRRSACELSRPPRDSAVTGNHGLYYFVYPRSVDSDYSGCQTMWDELSQPVFILTFEHGTLTEFSAPPEVTCRYENARLASSASQDCPGYESVKKGALTLPKEYEPQVPPERDPRR